MIQTQLLSNYSRVTLVDAQKVSSVKEENFNVTHAMKNVNTVLDLNAINVSDVLKKELFRSLTEMMVVDVTIVLLNLLDSQNNVKERLSNLNHKKILLQTLFRMRKLRLSLLPIQDQVSHKEEFH
jgi:hypothetical protein